MNSKQENYQRFLIAGLVLTLLLVLAFGVYWIGESARLADAKELSVDERVNRGQAIYQEQCAACHGAQGEGGVGPALNNRALLKSTLDEVFFSVVRSGVPNTKMPAWSVDYGGPLTDEDVRDVVAYMRSWEPTTPEIAPIVFEPSAERGALLFSATCAACHGEGGAGGKQMSVEDIKRFLDTFNKHMVSIPPVLSGLIEKYAFNAEIPSEGISIGEDSIEEEECDLNSLAEFFSEEKTPETCVREDLQEIQTLLEFDASELQTSQFMEFENEFNEELTEKRFHHIILELMV